MSEYFNHHPTVYNFDKHDKFYLSKELADPDQLEGKGFYLLPGSATFIPPIPEETDGAEIAVFDELNGVWEMKPNDYWRPTITRRYVNLGNTLDGNLSVTQLPTFSPIFKYKGIPRLIASSSILMSLSGHLKHISRIANQLNDIFNSAKQSENMYEPDEVLKFKSLTYDLIFNMKRFVDDVFINEWIELERDSAKFKSERKIEIQGANEVDTMSAGCTKDYLMGLKTKHADFLLTLRDMRNSFAHHITVSEALNIMGLDHPMITTIYAKSGKIDSLTLIEVCLEDLIKYFNLFVNEILETNHHS